MGLGSEGRGGYLPALHAARVLADHAPPPLHPSALHVSSRPLTPPHATAATQAAC